ncbi:hypothetical protein DFH09DRAFT_1094489 [Mycena vulgaris]|nr:hypothetical protein DFH09DRAFT_1094489 [Mycena vulgaris]
MIDGTIAQSEKDIKECREASGWLRQSKMAALSRRHLFAPMHRTKARKGKYVLFAREASARPRATPAPCGAPARARDGSPADARRRGSGAAQDVGAQGQRQLVGDGTEEYTHQRSLDPGPTGSGAATQQSRASGTSAILPICAYQADECPVDRESARAVGGGKRAILASSGMVRIKPPS